MSSALTVRLQGLGLAKADIHGSVTAEGPNLNLETLATLTDPSSV